MSTVKQWYLIGSDEDHERAISRYEEVKRAQVGSDEHAEKMQLVNAISAYENEQWDLPELDQPELTKILAEDL